MKFHVIILCVCLMQICLGSKNVTDEKLNEEWKQRIRNELKGVSEQFLDDYVFIGEKMENKSFVLRLLSGGYLDVLFKIRREKTAQIDVNGVRDIHTKLNKYPHSHDYLAITNENLRVIQSILSKNVPSQRYNGIVNLCFVLLHPNATSKEIESALGYLYGTETKPILFDIPDSTAADCPTVFQKHSDAIDKLNSMVDLKRKVIEDSAIIRDKFPCNDAVRLFLERFVNLLAQLHGDRSKIKSCTMEQSLGIYEDQWIKPIDPWGDMLSELDPLESILSTRLTDKTFRGIMNFIKATKVGTTTDQIQMALEYLYDDASTEKCETKTE